MTTNSTSPTVSVIMPVYGAELTVAEAVLSVLDQSYLDFELIIVDDGSKDSSIDICATFDDGRLRIVRQANRGLAGARNTGIRHARGRFIALIDADDSWHPDKLRNHVIHLEASPSVGVSYAGSNLMDERGECLGVHQRPRLTSVRRRDIFLRNPIGNGSAPVIRREVFDAIAYIDPIHGERAFFDERFRQSEDIECWIRIALSTPWRFEGLPGRLTNYRLNAAGLSADTAKQLESWERMADKVAYADPTFFRRWGRMARGFQLRYLARRAVQTGDEAEALRLCKEALSEAPQLFLREPRKTISTVAAAGFLALAPGALRNLVRRRLFGRAAS
ncbi:glycosyltransferase family 2 protein [Parvularcula maris]|uniref:Glycosyltransferase n=1 Tax=Parvularcula maris TaxID=2965077 RepID=A0A9X2L881_9PROT|nr:glycosyltransferase family 2 protein [Parvularcula maris]MCQ8183952.1 glycosyltransferase [Parvularcula maris]